MKKMLAEFKDFLNQGNVVMIAVALVMALFVADIVNAIIEGVIMPIVSAIAGKQNFEEIGFDLGDARISIGLVIQAIVIFIIVAFVLFWIVKAYNRFAKSPEAGPTDVDLLIEIRDELRASR
jgi:large conductance mechanosensitive channel